MESALKNKSLTDRAIFEALYACSWAGGTVADVARATGYKSAQVRPRLKAMVSNLWIRRHPTDKTRITAKNRKAHVYQAIQIDMIGEGFLPSAAPSQEA